MEICLLSRFFDLRNGGIGRYSMELLRRLRSSKYEVKTVSQDGGLPLGEGRLKYFIYTMFEFPFKIPESDIYHACSPMESIHSPTPLVVTFHDFIPLLYTDKAKTHYRKSTVERLISSGYFKLSCSEAIRKANAITAVSNQTKQELATKFGVDKDDITIIRHGVRPDMEPKPKKDDIFRIGTLSFLDPRKRIDILIKSFLEADIDGELVIAGRGTNMSRLKKLTGGDERIKFLGFVPDDQLNDFYNSLNIFAFPTKLEGYGLPAVEAMACKKPVITLSDSIMPDDIKDRTVVVDDLTEFLEYPDFSKIDLEKNYQFSQLHDWKKCSEEYLKIYEEIYEM